MTETPTPIQNLEEPRGISPSTQIHISVRTAIALLVGIIVMVGSAVASYSALAATDRETSGRISQCEAKIAGTATREDLATLRIQVQMDMLNAVWYCQGAAGGMTCRPQLLRQ